MNSIHDNQKVIDAEKAKQDKGLADEQYKDLIPPPKDEGIELNAGNELIGKPKFEEEHILTTIEKAQAEKDAYYKKLEEENAYLHKKLIEKEESEKPSEEIQQEKPSEEIQQEKPSEEIQQEKPSEQS